MNYIIFGQIKKIGNQKKATKNRPSQVILELLDGRKIMINGTNETIKNSKRTLQRRMFEDAMFSLEFTDLFDINLDPVIPDCSIIIFGRKPNSLNQVN